MSGFSERVIEDWLTKADERSYQLPFAASLAKSGYVIKYLSSHTTLEHGKDIVATGVGKVHAYQLKAGNINTSVWRAIVEEVRSASFIPVDIPGMKRKTPDRAYLVLSGRLADPVRNLINLMNDDLAARGYAVIETIELDELISVFSEAFGSFFPSAIEPLNEFLQLYLRNGRGPQDKGGLCRVLESVIGTTTSATSWRRRLSNVVVAAEFVSAPYRHVRNHVSLIETWGIAAAQILRVARERNLTRSVWGPSIDLCAEAISLAGIELENEVFERADLVEGHPLMDATFVGARKTVALLAWIHMPCQGALATRSVLVG